MSEMKKKPVIFGLFVISFVALVISPSVISGKTETKTIIVPDDYANIGLAISSASEGDTIFVKKGTYYNQSLVISKAVSLVGEDAETTILRGLDAASYTQYSNSMDKTNYDQRVVAQTNNNSQNSNLLQQDLENAGLSLNNFRPPITILIQIKAYNVMISGFTITNVCVGITGTGDETKITDNIVTGLDNGIILEGSHNIISENVIKWGLTGIKISGTYNMITANNLSDTSNQGIELHGDKNSVVGNFITSFGSIGISMQNANYNNVSKNVITDGTEGLAVGLSGNTCSHNTISGNRIERLALWGILMCAGSHNVFYENNIAYVKGTNSAYGVALGGNHIIAQENMFYHNNFVNNKNVGYNWELLGIGNSWDNGKEGNYWVGYNGKDSDGDGIGDTPYIIDGQNRDNYPLMEPVHVEVIPEFPSWISLLLVIAVTVVVIVCKHKLTKQQCMLENK